MSNSENKTDDTAGSMQRATPHEQRRHEAGFAPGQGAPGPVQSGARHYPGPPQPAQQLDQPGTQESLRLRPQFLAPDYCGSGKLAGMVAIITGGDAGIGRAVAVLYAREGADVAIIYRDEHEDANETKRFVEAEGQSCLLIGGDVCDPHFCLTATEQVIATFGRIDILVNHATFEQHAEALLELTVERFDLTMKTSVYGYFHMVKAVLPHLQRGAAIINTGSVTGLRGARQLLDYSTTNGAIDAFTLSLAAKLLDQGIRVNAVAPGPVWTPLKPADQTSGRIASVGLETGMRRPAQPEDLSPAYVFLASAACSSHISGIVLPVTGSIGD